MDQTALSLNIHPNNQLSIRNGMEEADGCLPVTSLGPVLVVAPHPDDETLGCGGLIARCAALGCPMTVLTLTSGEASHPGDDCWKRRLGATRRKEQREALRRLGLTDPDNRWQGQPDGGLESLDTRIRSELVARVTTLLHERRIRTVFLPAVDDCHGDHRAAARLLAAAIADDPVDYVFSYQIWPPRQRPGHVIANEIRCTLHIADLLDAKREAIAAHRSQLGPIDVDHAEGFLLPAELIAAKLQQTETYALIRNLMAWSK